MSSTVLGLLIVLCGGLFQGSFLAPSKWVRGWAWENYWLIFALTAYLVSPWVVALLVVPNLWEIYRGTDRQDIAQLLIFGTGWGIGAVTFGLGVEAIGLALGFAIILGMSATAGTLIPLLVKPPANFSSLQVTMTGLSLLLLLAGVAVCSFAGKWKETQSGQGHARSYRAGVLICIVSGLLSACGSFGFAFADELKARAISLEVPGMVASNLVWPLLGLPLFICNAGYALYLLNKRRTFGEYRNNFGRNFALSLSMGLMWLAGMVFYGAGAFRLGALGPSLGWAMLMSSMVLVANVLGILTGEWEGAPPTSRKQLGLGVLLLVLAIAGLGYANQLQQVKSSDDVAFKSRT